MVENRHIKKFMGGRATPREVHAATSVRRQCLKCPARAIMRIRVLADLDELTRRQPVFTALVAADAPGGRVPTVDTTYGKMVMLHDVGACAMCRKAVEVQVAHGAEDWMLVEVDRGPAPINAQIMMPN